MTTTKNSMRVSLLWVGISLFGPSALLLGCEEKTNSGANGATAAAPKATARAAQTTAAEQQMPPDGPKSKETDGSKLAGSPTGTARVGSSAPDFSLTDLDGNEFHLREHLGKIVVLEWFNPDCPFIRLSHTKGSLVDAASRLQKQGIVYVSINSSAPGKQGYGEEANRAGAAAYHLSHPILMDATGRVGKLYGATNTPHMFVVDQQGKLAYAGAVDNSKDAEQKSPEGGTLVKFMEQAVSELLAGKPVSIPETQAYGCSVKY